MNIKKNKQFFTDELNLTVGKKIVLSDGEHNHLRNVLRMREGEFIDVLNNTNFIYGCTIISIDKKSTCVRVDVCRECECNPMHNLTVFVGLLKGDKLEMLAQKITELGATKMVPFYSSLCIAKPNANKKSKLIEVSKGACKQCGRSKFVEVEDTMMFDDMCKQFEKFDSVYFANEGEDFSNRLGDVFGKNIAIVVGSEGGFSEEEIAMATAFGAASVSLGKRILRAETAVMALCSVLAFKNEEI